MLPLLLLACTDPVTPAETGTTDTGTPTTSDVVQLAADGLDEPVDAAPSADGSQFFVLTADAGLWQLPADGSEAPTLLFEGLRAARGLSVSLDGTEVFVTAETEEAGQQMHAIHLDGSGDVPHTDTLGLSPGGLTGLQSLTRASHRESVYFTGRHGASATGGDEGAVWFFPSHGVPVLLATGFDGGLPEAIEAAPDRSLYVAVVTDGVGSLWHIPAEIVAQDGAADPTTAATRVFDGFLPGEPPGIALTGDAGTLLISSLSAEGTSQVVLFDTATGGSSVFDEVIRANHRSGGVHRARDVDVFAWADRAGGVYRVGL